MRTMRGCQGGPTGGTGNYLYIEPSAWNDKYIVVHELGHAVAEASNQWQDEDSDGSATLVPPCDGGIVDVEYTSKAVVEGIAWYYAAVVFNDNTTGAGGEIRKRWNYNNIGSIDPNQNEESPSVEGIPYVHPLVPYETWPNEDYLGDMCGVTTDDRATTFDVLRALWDADTDQSFSTCQIFDLWDLANPDDWDPNGGSGANDAEERLESAASALGKLSEWTTEADANGVR